MAHSNFSQTVSSLSITNRNTTTADTITIGDGKTLTVSGDVTIGANADNSTTLATVTGLGTLTMASGVLQIGGVTTYGSGDNAATLDMSGLSNFTANLTRFQIGDNIAAYESVARASTAILAKTSSITATTISVGGATLHSGVEKLYLGETSNTINANTIHVGESASSGGGGRANGLIQFHTTTGTLKIRSATDTTNGRANLNLINTVGGTGGILTGTVDLSGHDSDLRLGTLAVAVRTGSATTGGSTGTFSFDQGALDVTTITLATKTGGGTGTSNGTVNIGGGTANIGSISMASADSGQTANAKINLTGGTTTLGGNITKTGGTGTTTATVTLDGGTLDMAGFSIGGTNTVTLEAKSGTLKNLGQLNNGGTLTKTGGGTLTLTGSHAYTGTTTVNSGKLTIASGGTINSTSGVSIGAGEFNYNSSTALSQGVSFSGLLNGILSGSGTITPAVTVTSGNTYTPGAVNGVGAQSLSGGITFDSGSIFSWDLTSTTPAYDAVTANSLAGAGGAIFKIVLGSGDSFADTFWNSSHTWSASDVFGTNNVNADLASIFTSTETTGYFNANPLQGSFSFTSSGIGTSNNLTWTAVPEPTSALAGILLGAGLLRRRRK